MRPLAIVVALAASAALAAHAQGQVQEAPEESAEEGGVSPLPEIGPAVFLSIDGERAYRIEDWIGAPVQLAGSGEEIGEVETLMLGGDGRTIAALVGVGGFLGIGEKLVAVDIGSLNAVREEGDFFLQLDATRGQIERAEPVVLDD